MSHICHSEAKLDEKMLHLLGSDLYGEIFSLICVYIYIYIHV